MNLMPSVSELTTAAKPPPATRGRECVLPFFPQNEFFHGKKWKNNLIFSPTTCKLCLGIAFPTIGNPILSSFQPYFNQKYTKTDQVCNNSFDPEHEIPAGALCLRFCWAFLCRLGIGFLVGPSCTRMGKRPAFLCSNVKNLNLIFTI